MNHQKRTKVTTSLQALGSVGILANGKHEESHIKGGEEEDERNRVSESADEHQKGEDEPSEKVEPDCSAEFFCISSIRCNNVETGDLNDSVREPESTIAAQSSCAESVSNNLEY